MRPADEREEVLFREALQRAIGPERDAFLDRACAGNPALRGRLDALLQAHESPDPFLEPLAAAPAGATVVGRPEEGPGTVIGRYKLLQEIGEGGCGVVYMAEQETPMRRRVALKIIKLGMDTKQVVARFEAERQALAMMDHPNIAQVLDGGATETGRPYFVMELVRGVRITDYCDQNNLPTVERLKLFLQVCHAIQHAHQKGVIHRDIKPSNILVSLHDDVPVAKVIDFGIAKAIGHRLTDKTVFTRFEQFIGTPAYMSPEQAGVSGLDIDTRSDIYALGVLLYELLTGQAPFDPKQLAQAGLEEILRRIREEEPPKPSTRLSTLAREELTTTAARRQTEPPKLIGLLRGDLDWIVMKCLEKNRTRRYETASALAQDIQRHLENEPITARPPSKVYRVRKLVRRNKLAFAAGAAVAVSLVIGLALATIMFFRERTARQQADEQAAIARAVNDFLQNDLLRQADSKVQADARFKADPNLTVREALQRASQRIGERFRDQPLTELAIRVAIGDALRGVGQEAQAVPHLLRAMELSRVRLGPDHLDTLKCKDDLAATYTDAGNVDRALPLLEETLKLRKAKLGPDHPDTLTTMFNLGYAHELAGKLDRAALLLEETLKLRKARLGPDHPDTLRTMAMLGETYAYAGNPDHALLLFEETLKLRKAKLGPDHPDTLSSVNNLAVAYDYAGRPEQALPLYEENLENELAGLGPDHPETLSTKHNLGSAYAEFGKLDQALPLLEEVLKTRRVMLGSDHPHTLLTMNRLVEAYVGAGRSDQALVLSEEGVQLARGKLGPDHFATLRLMGNLACAYQAAGKLDQALPLHEQTVSLAKAKLGPDHPYTLKFLNNLAWAYQAAGKLDQALPLFEEALKSRRAKLGREHPDTLITLANLGNCLLRQGSYTNAEALARECFEMRQKTTPNDWRTFAVQTSLGMALLGQKKYAEAEPLLLAGYEGMRQREERIPAAGRKHPKEAIEHLVQLYEETNRPGKVAEWRPKLAQFEQAESGKQPAAPPR